MPALSQLDSGIRKESAWLLREISTLQQFKSEVEDILRLKEKVTLLTKLASSKSAKEMEVANEQMQREIADMKRLQRSAGKDERRRIRFEKRVLGKINSLQREIDQPRQKELEDVVNQIHVYSGRILSEISLRAGKVADLLGRADYVQLEKHLVAIKEAGTALLALLKHLDSMVIDVENVLERKQLVHRVLPSIGAFQGYIREGIIKTAHLKSIISLEILLEKKMKKYRSWSGLGKKVVEVYLKTLDKNKEYLLKVLTTDDFEQLKKITFPVPAGSVLLFLPKFFVPVLAFNLQNLPAFDKPGWVFHATPGENLARLSQTWLLQTPLETVIEKKHVYSFRFWEHSAFPQRLIDGISFAFQDFVKYQDYLSGQESHRKAVGKTGGFFIFPIRNVLQPGLILDFRQTMDGLPEVDLRDVAYHQYNPRLVRDCLLTLREKIPRMLEVLDDVWLLFQESKKNISFFQELGDTIGKEDSVFSRVDERGVTFYYYNTIHIGDQEKIFWTRAEPFFRNFVRYLSVLNRNMIASLITVLTKELFFEFLLLMAFGFAYKRERLLPPLARFAPRSEPFGLDDTIFRVGMDFLNEERLDDKGPCFTAGCVILSMMKREQDTVLRGKGYSTLNYLDEINKLEPKELKRLLQRTMNDLIRALDVIVKKRYRSNKPCVVDITKGVLFLNWSFVDDGVLKRLAADGVPMFTQFSSHDRIFSTGQLDFFFKAVLPLKSFPQTLEKSLWHSYLYLDQSGKLTLQRVDEIEYSSEKKEFERKVRKAVVLD